MSNDEGAKSGGEQQSNEGTKLSWRDGWRMTSRERDRRVGMAPCARIGHALRVETTRGPGKGFAKPRAGACEHGR